MFPLFQKYLNTQVRTNKLVNSVVYHLCPSILASGIHPYFFKLLRVLSLSRMLVQFSLTCIFHHVWGRIFNLWYSHQKMNWIYAFLLIPQFPTQNSRYNFLKICFPQGPRTKGVKETMICFIKIQSQNMKMTWNISLFICFMIYDLSKCDDFTVLVIISIK